MHTHRAPVANPPTDRTCPSCGAPYAREPGRSGNDASAGHTHPPDVLAPECRVCHMLIALTRGLPPDYIDKLRNLTAQRKAAR